MMIKSLVATGICFLTLPCFRAAADCIVSFNPPDDSTRSLLIYSGQGGRVGWTQADNYVSVNIWASLTSNNRTGQTGYAYLTTKIGPGTSVANQIASTSFTFPPAWTNVLLFQNLALPAGAYYLSIIGDSSSSGYWAFNTHPVTGPNVTFYGAYGASGSVSNYFPATGYDSSPTPQDFTVQGLDITHPILQIAPSGNFALLSWKTNASGFTLESSRDLNGTNWQDVPQPPAVISDSYVVPVNAAGTEFYRLRK
ncbi:MAG: hypothetical protein KGR98_14955 [Verrucomicrobia bacterium]|nr:hypothetical protein [Verrucomicrobiota bacterium]MDE3099215.1 hypothetical protein [Verrucomicrobiota bacterium]